MVLKTLTLPTSIPDDDSRLNDLDPPFKTRLRLQSKDLLIEEEVRRRKFVPGPWSHLRSPDPFFLFTSRAIKMNLANEGLEARKKDEEVAAKKRKAEDDKHWEGPSVRPNYN